MATSATDHPPEHEGSKFAPWTDLTVQFGDTIDTTQHLLNRRGAFMSNALAKAFLKAKMDFDHSVSAAIKDAATKFHEQTGVKPSTIRLEMEYDCIEHDGRLEYTLKHAGFDYNLDEVA